METIEQLQRRVAELAEAVAARDGFLAIAAHELRNPMTPIVGQVERLLGQVETRTLGLEGVEQSLRRIQWLIQLYVKRATTLLDVSRITTGKLRLEITEVDASGLIHDVIAAHEPLAQHSRCKINVDIQDGVNVSADRLALEQIVDNLVLNALKYGAGAPVGIGLTADAETFCVTVSDNGIGISKDAQERIFERFERAVSKSTQAGFGVGLWVVGQLVDAMNGKITVDSVPDEGTTFVVTLPRTVVQEP